MNCAFCGLVLLASCTSTSIRYSSNPIGKLAVLGIHVSESVDAANLVLQDPFGKNFLKEIDWPVVVDSTCKQLKEPQTVTLSFSNEQSGGVTHTSALFGGMAFTADMPGFIMDGDRQDRVEREANRLVEDLLLNIDKAEKVTCAEGGVSQQSVISIGEKTVMGTDDRAEDL